MPVKCGIKGKFKPYDSMQRSRAFKSTLRLMGVWTEIDTRPADDMSVYELSEDYENKQLKMVAVPPARLPLENDQHQLQMTQRRKTPLKDKNIYCVPTTCSGDPKFYKYRHISTIDAEDTINADKENLNISSNDYSCTPKLKTIRRHLSSRASFSRRKSLNSPASMIEAGLKLNDPSKGTYKGSKLVRIDSIKETMVNCQQDGLSPTLILEATERCAPFLKMTNADCSLLSPLATPLDSKHQSDLIPLELDDVIGGSDLFSNSCQVCPDSPDGCHRNESISSSLCSNQGSACTQTSTPAHDSSMHNLSLLSIGESPKTSVQNKLPKSSYFKALKKSNTSSSSNIRRKSSLRYSVGAYGESESPASTKKTKLLSLPLLRSKSFLLRKESPSIKGNSMEEKPKKLTLRQIKARSRSSASIRSSKRLAPSRQKSSSSLDSAEESQLKPFNSLREPKRRTMRQLKSKSRSVSDLKRSRNEQLTDVLTHSENQSNVALTRSKSLSAGLAGQVVSPKIEVSRAVKVKRSKSLCAAYDLPIMDKTDQNKCSKEFPIMPRSWRMSLKRNTSVSVPSQNVKGSTIMMRENAGHTPKPQRRRSRRASIDERLI